MKSPRLLTTSALLVAAAAGVLAGERLPDPLEAGWKGESVCKLVHDGLRQRVLRCTFPPGIGHERHRHAPHTGYVLEGGRMQITDKDGTRVVETRAHSSWHSDGIEWHEVVNVGDRPTSYLIIEPRN